MAEMWVFDKGRRKAEWEGNDLVFSSRSRSGRFSLLWSAWAEYGRLPDIIDPEEREEVLETMVLSRIRRND